jgi:hypothetical protein
MATGKTGDGRSMMTPPMVATVKLKMGLVHDMVWPSA